MSKKEFDWRVGRTEQFAHRMHLPAWRSRMDVHPMSELGVQNSSLIGCIFQPGVAGWTFIRCVELRDWPAFYTSDKLLRLRQQKMYRMKKGFVTA